MNRDSDTNIIRLPRTTYAPSVSDLGYFIQKTRDSKGGSVESAWAPPGSKQIYLLSVSLKVGTTMPIWKLFEQNNNKLTVLWSAESAELIKVAETLAKLSGTVQGVKPEVPSKEFVAEAIAESQKAASQAVEQSRDTAAEMGDLDFLGSSAENVHVLESQLVEPVSGVFSYSVLRKFLEYECGRFQTFGVPLTLIVFRILGPERKPLPSSAATTAGIRLTMIKNRLDVVGVFEDFDLAILLPNTTPAAASFVAHKAMDILTASPLAPGLNKSTLDISFSIGGLPDHGDDLNGLIFKVRKLRATAGARA